MMRTARLSLLLAAAFSLGACALDFTSPNEPTEEDVFGNPEAIKAVAVGLQAEYSDNVVDPTYVNGLVTEEIGAANNTFASYQDADAGRPLENTSDLAGGPWRGQYRVIKLANDLIRAVPEAELAPGTKSGILALAKTYKAMALGNLIQIFEKIPLEVGTDILNPPFADRAAVLTEILRLLNEARAELQQTAPSPEFQQQIIAPGFNLASTIDAMTARYALIAGNLDLALQAAQRVPLNVMSELRFAAPQDRNPLNNLWYRSGNAYRMRPEQSFRLQAEAGDQRVAFWVRAATVDGGDGQVLDELNRYTTDTDPIPVYLPDEMRLIQAEVYARTNRLAEARQLVNAVRTQCAPAVTGDPVACLPALSDAQLATQQQILAEIYKQRRYELYLQAVSWEDQRRFGVQTKYPWMVYPLSECDQNSNAPC